MISVILYGRNDTHGYNLHRRAALSLNCLAEVLTDPEDEILFVDYNTPDELPTFVEALSDTLTERCLELLRVLRVRGAVHQQRFAAHTHLPAVEPVSRNAAARRSNPANRWLLSTNTDMILLPRSDLGLSEICNDLPDGFYGLPRFELPEWLWEHLPRSDPRSAMAELERLGPDLHLDEPTLSYEWIRFDAPGDFQLILREDFTTIGGFDEAMVLGWHVDANLSRRMFLHRGSIESLEGDVAAYHCNHNRTPTVYHRDEATANDLDRFFFSIDRAELPGQSESWGLAEATLEEVPVRRRIGPAFTNAVLAAAADAPVFRWSSDSREAKFALEYDSSHVLPFIADSLSVLPPDATIAYIGGNRVLERMLAALVAELELGRPLAVAELADVQSTIRLDQVANVFVIDLGIDVSLLEGALGTGGGEEYAHHRARLLRAFDAFRRLVELERGRLARRENPRRFVLVNSSAVFWNAYVLAQLHCSPTTPHSRVRNAVVKLLPDVDDETRAADVRAQRLYRWIARRDIGPGRLRVRVGEAVEVADLDDYGGFGEGWAFPDKTAVWTRGARSELSLELDEICDGPGILTLSFDEIGVPPESPFTIHLLANGDRIAACDFPRVRTELGGRRGVDNFRDALRLTLRKPVAGLVHKARAVGVPGVDRAVAKVRRVLGWRAGDPFTWRVLLPSEVLASGKVELTLAVQEPVSWSDDRRRGLRLRSLTVGERRHRRRLEIVGKTARRNLPQRGSRWAL